MAAGPDIPPNPPPDPRSDAELVAAASQGDEQAMTILYLRHRDWCFRLALRYTHNAEGAADAVQEAFAWVLGKLPRLTLRAKMTTLLFPIVKNCALAAKRKKAPTSVGDALPERGTADEAGAREAPERRALMAALGALPEAQRETLLMRVIDGMTVPEIAAALDIPEGTVKSRLHHAIRQLKDDPALKALVEP
jgi:RNA polymerase sigma-70 factor (ECF subfamily)